MKDPLLTTPTKWFDRKFAFGLPAGMLPFFLERLEGTIVRLESKMSSTTDEILSNPFEGKWSVKQHIGHLAEVDQIANIRLDEMVNGISPMSPAVFEPKFDYNAQPIFEVLKYFRENRLQNIHKYSTLKETDLERSSLHPRLKLTMTPVDLALFDAEHDDHHLVAISRIIKSLKS